MQGASHMLLEEPLRLASVLSPAKPVSARRLPSRHLHFSLCSPSPAPVGSRALCDPVPLRVRTVACSNPVFVRMRQPVCLVWSVGRSVGWLDWIRIRFGARRGGESAGFSRDGGDPVFE